MGGRGGRVGAGGVCDACDEVGVCESVVDLLNRLGVDEVDGQSQMIGDCALRKHVRDCVVRESARAGVCARADGCMSRH